MATQENQTLTLHGRERESVFNLLGRKEVDLTAALGWTLTRSPTMMRLLWEHLGMPGDPAEVEVELEAFGTDGRTDIELRIGLDVHVIIEAKRGWILPEETQLTAYAPRTQDAATRLLVSLSDSSTGWAHKQLPDAVTGVPVRHLAWDAIRTAVRQARRTTRNQTERLWLAELTIYLAGASSVRPPAEQWVFCVVASNRRYGTQLTFREWVRDRRVYFHPYGGASGWPKRAPTFLAFRWNGAIRQVNRVEYTELVDHLADAFFDIPRTESGADGRHIIYHLGPDIPVRATPTTGTYANGRVWTLLDLLMTEPTLRDAVRRSKELTREQR